MVDSDICPDDDSRKYMGRFGSCYAGEYALFGERIYFDREELLEDYYCDNEDLYECFGDYRRTQEQGKALDDKLKEDTNHMWTKAIIVNIDSL